MTIAKIEPSGCTVRKGWVQIRFSFYLEPTDPRYEEHHVEVIVLPFPDAPLGGYPGEVVDRYGFGLGEIDGMPVEGNVHRYEPVDQADYDAWLEYLPKIWQDNPFHNHFEYVDADVTDAEIVKLLKGSLDEFFAIWSTGQDILKVWKPKYKLIEGDISSENIQKCELKALDVVNRALEFIIREEKWLI